ncbi:acyl-CoA dehydrogenase domain protein [Segniliparus rotundus DSM 44985]|uniref:Acyl-CoA dehydrogenase domain protein n=1 Tax=Segniliparus rotundus (strain ATCC BAA-972 / CDC 1076 / CIP 108378 / DSM 44985 / JCM 13578) TaxID=640132 RepID=D6ZAW9_SEGRD|nr:acyl-CoA dehydrogenase family protein [Segniliparus rotundus]ADG98855.1 acyl-CoA dehydrogenase domain protein [Segniliparus rotundus DSM 44985]
MTSETRERQELRAAVSKFAAGYGPKYMDQCWKADEYPWDLWREAGKLGFLGVNIPEEFGGGGAGMYELSLVAEELNAQGSGLLLMVVSPAICGNVINRFGTDEQRQQWLPGLGDGSKILVFGITEPDAGSNSHRITTTATRDGSDWLLTGRKVYISGVDVADAVLIVARTEDAKTGSLKPALFIVPRDTPGFEYRAIEMALRIPEHQFELAFDNIRLPAESLVGDPDAGIMQLFAGLNPERIMAAAGGVGTARYALRRAVDYAKTRTVFRTPIGAHQAIAHPLAQIKVEMELAKLMMQKAATLYDAGDDTGAAEAANMAKYAAGEVGARAVDQAVQTLGGNGLTVEYDLGTQLANSRLMRIAPVSREMALNYIASTTLGLPKSY